jgi:hypothetical protein
MGRALTHRRQIVARWLAGEEYTEIAAATSHGIPAVASYVEKFKRCAALLGAGFDRPQVGLIARLSPSLTAAFAQLLAEAQPVAHRQEELDALADKKGARAPRPGRCA